MGLPPSSVDKTGEADIASSGLDRWIALISLATASVGAVVVLLMMLIVTYSVINRYVLGTPITWTDELSGYLVVALVMLGAAEALRRGDHISVDLVTSRLNEKWQHIAAIFGNIMVLVVAVALLISGKETLEYSINFDILSVGYLEVPMWIPQSFLILGALMLALVAGVNLLKLVRQGTVP